MTSEVANLFVNFVQQNTIFVLLILEQQVKQN
jgi:hypothetical protein